MDPADQTDSTQPRSALTEAERAALEHAWNWFSLHSGQRMQLLSFFFAALALLVAGYTAALEADRPVIAVGISVAGLTFSVAFGLIDRRTKELVKAAEAPLAVLQQRLAVAASVPSLELASTVETAGIRVSSYSRVIGLFVTVAILLMTGGLVYALLGISCA